MAIYAFASDSDKTARLNRLKMDRMRFNRCFVKVGGGEGRTSERNAAHGQNEMLYLSDAAILESAPDYNADTDISNDTNPTPYGIPL